MSNIKGTIVNVKDFLALDAVNIRITGASESIFMLFRIFRDKSAGRLRI